MSRLYSLIIVAALFGAVRAEDGQKASPGPQVPIEKATIDDLSQWVMNYYRHPDPENFVARVRRMSALDMINNGRPEANEMFLGQIMRSNPDRIAGWMKELADLPEANRRTLQNAVWVSQTDQGKAWLAANGRKDLAEKEGHPLTTGAAMVLEPYVVDLCWEWFLATGDEAPVRRIVSFFNMLPDDPGDADLPEKPVPGGDRPTYLRKMIGGAAVWSASSLASRHERLLEILKRLQKDPQLPPRGAAWLKRTIEIAERKPKA